MKPSNPTKFNTQIYSEASYWLVEFRSGDVDAVGRKAFYEWLRTSPEHMRAYVELAAIWNEGSRLDPNRAFGDEDDLLELARSDGNVVPFTGPVLSHSSLPVLEEHESAAPSPASKATSPSKSQLSLEATSVRGNTSSLRILRGGGSRRRFLGIAASLLGAIFCVWAYGERNTYATGVGEQRSIPLADGSTIELNTRSKIRIRFTADRRAIELVQGQALFHVAKDKTRPFIVQSDNTTVRAVGTEFDVYRRATGTTVTVIDGRVAVLPPPSAGIPVAQGVIPTTGPELGPRNGQIEARPQGLREAPSALSSRQNATDADTNPGEQSARHSVGAGPVATVGEFLLVAGEQVILTPTATVKPTQPDIAAATAWTLRRLVFQSTKLQEVIEEFNRYNTRQLVINDSELSAMHVTGAFASTDPSSLIRFLLARPGVNVIEKDDKILIGRSPQ